MSNKGLEGKTARRVVRVAVLTGSSLLVFVAIYVVLISSSSNAFSRVQVPARHFPRASIAAQGDSNRSKDMESRLTESNKLNKAAGSRGTALTSTQSGSGYPRERRPPDFIVIGVRKCGTRALLSMISLHPQVVSAGPEVHYFDRDSNYKRGLNWYVSRMPKSRVGQLTGEKSPSYFVTPGVPTRIRDFTRTVKKEVKLLVVVRNPVDRVISDYSQRLSKKEMSLSQTKLIREDFRSLVLDPHTGRIDKRWTAITTGQYSSHLAKWFKVFPRRQVHIVNGDNLITSPLEEIKKVSSFLGLNEEFDWDSHLYYNKTRGFYCFKDTEINEPFCLGNSKGRPHPHIEGALLKEFRDFYRPYNRKFKAMTGLDVKWAT